ncbi:1107_t:CDS:2, partial [Gigaspora rosea]
GYIVEENKDKRVKVEIDLLLTYLKSTKSDHTNIIEDLRDYQTWINDKVKVVMQIVLRTTVVMKWRWITIMKKGKNLLKRRSWENWQKDQLKSVPVEEEILSGNI